MISTLRSCDQWLTASVMPQRRSNRIVRTWRWTGTTLTHVPLAERSILGCPNRKKPMSEAGNDLSGFCSCDLETRFGHPYRWVSQRFETEPAVEAMRVSGCQENSGQAETVEGRARPTYKRRAHTNAPNRPFYVYVAQPGESSTICYYPRVCHLRARIRPVYSKIPRAIHGRVLLASRSGGSPVAITVEPLINPASVHPLGI
ncbi:hypothetical protein H4V95_002113 [Arthrobacter sp. CAN_C5]|nr:hypothetical protein [Arthrobacter sp. CAN_C5]